jgi:hypothetical protein
MMVVPAQGYYQYPKNIKITYLARLCKCVIDIEQKHRVLDWALVERRVNRSCGGHLEICANLGS